MAITLRSPNGTTTVAYGNRTNTTVARPSGMAAGDFAIVALTCGGSTLAQPTNAGATLVSRVTYSASDPWSVDLSLWLVPYSAGASWTWAHAARSSQAFAVALAGVDPTTPIDVSAVTANKSDYTATNPTPVAPSITTVTAQAWQILVRGSWDGNAITPPTGVTEHHDTPVLWVGTRELGAAGATGTVTVASGNSGNSPWGVIHTALRPAGTSTPPGQGSGTGSFAFSGSGSGRRSPKATGGSTVAFSGSGVGFTTRRGSGSGTVSISGSGSGRTARRGMGSGTLAWAGSGSGSAPTVGGAAGSGSGVVAYVGAGSGKRTPKASGTGVVAFAGTGSGTAPAVDQRDGSGSGSWVFGGSGAGKRSPIGSGTGVVVYAGAGTGVTRRSGTGAGSLAITGAGFGVDPANVRDSARILATAVRTPAATGTTRAPQARGTLRTPTAQGRLR